MHADERTGENEPVPREITSDEEIDEQQAVRSDENIPVQRKVSDEVDSHELSEVLQGSANFPGNKDAVEVSRNEHGGQKSVAPTAIHRYLQRVRKVSA